MEDFVFMVFLGIACFGMGYVLDNEAWMNKKTPYCITETIELHGREITEEKCWEVKSYITHKPKAE